MRRWLLVLVLVSYAWLTHRYVPVWQSDLTLWAHAMKQAPLKPTVAVNYSLALLLRSQWTESAAVLDRAELVATLPHVPAPDRALVARAIATNRPVIMAAQTRP